MKLSNSFTPTPSLAVALEGLDQQNLFGRVIDGEFADRAEFNDAAYEHGMSFDDAGRYWRDAHGIKYVIASVVFVVNPSQENAESMGAAYVDLRLAAGSRNDVRAADEEVNRLAAAQNVSRERLEQGRHACQMVKQVADDVARRVLRQQKSLAPAQAQTPMFTVTAAPTSRARQSAGAPRRQSKAAAGASNSSGDDGSDPPGPGEGLGEDLHPVELRSSSSRACSTPGCSARREQDDPPGRCWTCRANALAADRERVLDECWLRAGAA